MQTSGQGPGGNRRVGLVAGGTFGVGTGSRTAVGPAYEILELL